VTAAVSTRSPRHERGVPPLQALTLAFATARLTRLVVEDELTHPVREKILVQATKGRTAWQFTDELINCPACVSVWAGAGTLVAEQSGIGRFLVRVLALSQAALLVRTVTERIER
jgi:hypothetical protein